MRAAAPVGRTFVIADPATCIGCKTCMAACLHRHDVTDDVAVPRLTLVTTRAISAPVGCHHCAEAPCVDACPTGCLYSDDTHVGVRAGTCIGCRNCVLACPYGAVEIVTEKLPLEPEAPAEPTAGAAASAPTRHPERAEHSTAQWAVELPSTRSERREATRSGGERSPATVSAAVEDPSTARLRRSAQDDKGARARARAKKRKRTKSTVVKCDLCFDHAGGPACAAACPTKALRLIDARFLERAQQSKRKAAARATASYASMKLNADLNEGE